MPKGERVLKNIYNIIDKSHTGIIIVAMNRRDIAGRLLLEAQRGITQLATEALQEQAYDDAAWCAKVAGSLNGLANDAADKGHEGYSSDPTSRMDSVVSAPTDAKGKSFPSGQRIERELKASRRSGSNGSNSAAYPLFYRDKSMLVKIGWSKSQRGEYEHRAPKDAVTALIATAARAGNDGLFSMERLLPLRDARGEELPSYQAYLALAWLRSAELVTRHGQDGYSLDARLKEDGFLRELWDRLPTRKHVK